MNSFRKSKVTISMVFFLILGPLNLHSETTEKENVEESSLNLDLEISSSYIFRGLNLFMEDSNLDQNILLAPSVTWYPFDEKFSIAYWGGYQISGSNIRDNIKNGVGLEQDLVLKYDDISIWNNLTFSPSINFYIYPFADSNVAGTSVPTYFDPIFAFNYQTTFLKLGFNLTYYVGLEEAIRDSTYVYFNPTVSKEFTFEGDITLEILSGFGYKLYHKRSLMKDNVYDIFASSVLEIRLSKKVYLKPHLDIAWTNLEGKGISDEIAVLGGFHLGFDL